MNFKLEQYIKPKSAQPVNGEVKSYVNSLGYDDTWADKFISEYQQRNWKTSKLENLRSWRKAAKKWLNANAGLPNV